MAEVTVNMGTASVPVTIAGTTVTIPVSFASVGPAGPAGTGLPAGGTTGQVAAKASNDDYDVEWVSASGAGDMLAAIYDPTAVAGDAFSMGNMVETATAKILTADERTKLGNIEALADVTDAANVTAAGALMDSEVTNLAAVKAFDPADYDAAGTASGAVSTHASATSGVHGISTFGASLIDDASASAARTTLELGTAATSATGDFEAAGAVATHAAVTSGVHGISAFGATLVDDADAATARATLELGTAATSATGDFEAAGSVSTHAALTATHGVSGAIVGTSDSQTLTSKVIDGANNTLTVRLANDVTGDLPLANLAQASGASVLLGRGSAAGAGDFQEITLGTGLSMSGTVLSASASAPALGDVTDVTITTVASGEVLTYTGAGWENQTLAEADIASATTLSSHTSNTSNPHSVTKSQVGLANVENTALSSWTGATSITTLGTIGAGTWQGTAIGDTYISSATTWNAKLDDITGEALGDLGDVTITSVATGELLTYTGAGWENQTLAEAGIQGTITFGTGVETALGVNIGSAGAPVILNGAGGTPSALTLTNATGLPLTSGVTGTLPIANGGTGATTLPSPSNYTAGAATVPDHLSGIDTALGGKASATTPYYLQAALTANGAAIATGTNVAFVRVPVSGSITDIDIDCDPNNEPSAAAVQVDGNVVNRTTGASTSFLTAVASIATSANTGTGTIKSDGTEDVSAGDLLSFDIDQGSDGKDLIVTVEITPS